MLIGASEPAGRGFEPSLGEFARLPEEHPASSALGDPWNPQRISYTMSSLPHLKVAPHFVVFLPIAALLPHVIILITTSSRGSRVLMYLTSSRPRPPTRCLNKR